MQEIDLDHIFSYHKASAEEIPKFNAIREAAKHLASVIVINTPTGADQAAAVNKVREAVMIANASLALGGKLHK